MATKLDKHPRTTGDGAVDSLDSVVRRDAQLGFLPDLVALAVKHAKPDRIVLFGSRARGDHARGSDVDVAFYVPESGLGSWSRFVAEAEEGLRTLLKLDLVRVDLASDEMRRAIEREGIVIYG